ncbi:MAG: sodium-dependent transporter [Oligoflexales bacterium]
MSEGNRPKWSGSLGFVLAAAGSAVGLGNIWKFPYITGMNGGGAFVLVYLICIALVGVPVLLAELYIGKIGQANAVLAYEKVHNKKSFWRLPGALGLISAFVILSFYSVIGGWILNFEWCSLFNEFGTRPESEIKSMLSDLFEDPTRQIFLHLTFMLLTMGIVLGGVQQGIEKWTKLLMPGLVLILIGLLVYSLFLPGFGQAVEFLFLPDFSKLSWDSLLEAVGHSFFTLSVAVGVMVTFGSYLSKDDNLPKMGFSIALIDTVLALTAGLVIFTAVFSYGIEVDTGPTLIFQTLPLLFGKMPGGYFIAVTFFLLIAFTALTSTISILEVVVAYCTETFKTTRRITTVIVSLAAFSLGILSDLSTNVLSHIKIVGLNFFDFFDKLTSSLFLPLSGLLTSIFIGWVLGPRAIDEIIKDTGFEGYRIVLLICIRIIVPISVSIILFMGLDWIWA